MPCFLAKEVTGNRYKLYPHVKLINRKLCDIYNGKIDRLIIEAPPRHFKSTAISFYFSAWWLGMRPDSKVMLACYESKFAQEWGQQVREVLKEYGNDCFGVTIDPQVQAQSNFKIDKHTGRMYSVGAGGAIIGKGADLLIIDDPIKNYEEAHSQLMRDKVWNWFLSVAYSRLEPNAAIVIIMQRWHIDDIVGRLKKAEGEKWEILTFPALAEENDILGREVGEALCEDRYSKKKLLATKELQGSKIFSPMYQQNPLPDEDTLFKSKEFRYFEFKEDKYILYKEAGQIDKVVMESDLEFRFATVDLAISEKETADYTVFLIAATTLGGELLILDVIRTKIGAPAQLKQLHQIYTRYNLNMLYIEAVQYQTALIQNAVATGLPAEKLETKGQNKYVRALPAAAVLEAGKIYFQLNSSWLHDFEEELIWFPNGKNKDQVDAFAYAVLVSNELKQETFNIRTF